MAEPRKVSFTAPVGTGPEAIISEIKAGVTHALMEGGLPGAFSLTSDGFEGSVDARPTVSSKDGRVMYNMTGSVILGGQKWRVQGNILAPKSAGLAIGGKDLVDYQQSRTALQAKRDAEAAKPRTPAGAKS